MELLKNTQTQLSPVLKSISPTGRAAIAVAILLMIGGVSYMMNRDSGDQHVMLFGGRDLSRSEINSIETALSVSGCNEYQVIDNCIQIPLKHRSEILKAIDDAGAVPRSVTGVESEKNAFNPFMTGTQQKSLEKEKKQRKICAMIREINGISEVMVEYDETRSSGFPRKTERTAAVTVRSDGESHLEDFEIDTIRSMVQRAVAGMEPDDVVVIDGNSGIAHLYDDNPATDKSSIADYAAAKTHYEGTWKQKIENVLKSYPGADVTVQIGVTQVVRNQPGNSSFDAAPIASTTEAGGLDTPDQLAPSQSASPNQTQARIRDDIPGTNGTARIADFVIPENEELKTNPVSKTTAHIRRMSHVNTAWPADDSKRSTTDYIPNSASVSIVVPQSLVEDFARRSLKLKSQRAASDVEFKDANQNGRDQKSVTESESETVDLTQADLETYFVMVQRDITRRIAPLLPGNQTARETGRMIAVSMDVEHLPHAEPIAPQDAGFAKLLTSIDFTKLKGNLYAWLIPAVVVIGLVMLRINHRANAAVAKENRAARSEQSERIPGEVNAPQLHLQPEIEHNDLEPTEQEVRLTTDIDRAFENDYEAKLSKEVVDMIKDDPQTTINVFRSWLNDAA